MKVRITATIQENWDELKGDSTSRSRPKKNYEYIGPRRRCPEDVGTPPATPRAHTGGVSVMLRDDRFDRVVLDRRSMHDGAFRRGVGRVAPNDDDDNDSHPG